MVSVHDKTLIKREEFESSSETGLYFNANLAHILPATEILVPFFWHRRLATAIDQRKTKSLKAFCIQTMEASRSYIWKVIYVDTCILSNASLAGFRMLFLERFFLNEWMNDARLILCASMNREPFIDVILLNVQNQYKQSYFTEYFTLNSTRFDWLYRNPHPHSRGWTFIRFCVFLSRLSGRSHPSFFSWITIWINCPVSSWWSLLVSSTIRTCHLGIGKFAGPRQFQILKNLWVNDLSTKGSIDRFSF